MNKQTVCEAAQHSEIHPYYLFVIAFAIKEKKIRWGELAAIYDQFSLRGIVPPEVVDFVIDYRIGKIRFESIPQTKERGARLVVWVNEKKTLV